MKKNIKYVGLDVHAETIAVAVAEARGEVRSLGVIPNKTESVRRLVKKLRADGSALHVCYEAGPCGYVLYWQLAKLEVRCDVVAPTLIPVKAGDRVKTDRRDAEKLARLLRSGELTAVWVPDAAHEALRDLVRARGAAKKDQRRARQRLQKFLLRHGLRRDTKNTAWGARHMLWLRSLKFEHLAEKATFEDYLSEVDHQTDRLVRLEAKIDEAVERAPESQRAVIEALQALRGVAKLTAVTVVCELGLLSRFEKPRQLMAYVGLVPSEYSTGGPGKARRGGITKTGNGHLRRILTEAAWLYRHRPLPGPEIRRRRQQVDATSATIAVKAEKRLCARYQLLRARSKSSQQVATAIARELLGFIWAIGVTVERGERSQAA
jgi:transposase